MKWKVPALMLVAMVFLEALTALAGKMLFEDKFATWIPPGESIAIFVPDLHIANTCYVYVACNLKR